MNENIVLKLFLDHHYPKNPIYISNLDIEGFIRANPYISKVDFNAIRDFFLKELAVRRSIFSILEQELTFDKRLEFSIPVSPMREKHMPEKLNEFKESLQLRRYSRRTINSYVSAVKIVNNWFSLKKNKSIDAALQPELREYFLFLTQGKKASVSTVRMHRFALKYYFEDLLKKKFDFSFVENVKNADHVPVILSKNEVERLLGCILNRKHRTMVALLFSAGLRISECVSLKVGDVDVDRMIIHVKEGKGSKDRITILSDRLRDDMAFFMQGKAADEYLFVSNMKNRYGKKERLSSRTIQKVFETAMRNAGIAKKASPHDLRHSFATHLLESGISLRHIQHLLGHKNISTTTIYTRVAASELRKIKSPF